MHVFGLVSFCFGVFLNLRQKMSGSTHTPPPVSYASSSEKERTGERTHSPTSVVAAWHHAEFPDPVVAPRDVRLAMAKLTARDKDMSETTLDPSTIRILRAVYDRRHTQQEPSTVRVLDCSVQRRIVPGPPQPFDAHPFAFFLEKNTPVPSSGAPHKHSGLPHLHPPKISDESHTSGLSSGANPPKKQLTPTPDLLKGIRRPRRVVPFYTQPIGHIAEGIIYGQSRGAITRIRMPSPNPDAPKITKKSIIICRLSGTTPPTEQLTPRPTLMIGVNDGRTPGKVILSLLDLPVTIPRCPTYGLSGHTDDPAYPRPFGSRDTKGSYAHHLAYVACHNCGAKGHMWPWCPKKLTLFCEKCGLADIHQTQLPVLLSRHRRY